MSIHMVKNAIALIVILRFLKAQHSVMPVSQTLKTSTKFKRGPLENALFCTFSVSGGASHRRRG